MQDDPALTWIREVRHQISKQCDHDPKQFVEYYIQLQERYKDRLLDLVKTEQAKESSASS
jgi:hypothetical protein